MDKVVVVSYRKAALMAAIEAMATSGVNATPGRSFAHIVPVDLTSIFPGYGPLPAVTGLESYDENWGTTGQTRTVYFSDGSSVEEVLTAIAHPRYFSYRLNAFTGMLRFIVTHAEGEWWFEPSMNEKTLIKWHYTWYSRSIIAFPALWIIIRFFWSGYMNKALKLIKSQLEEKSI